MVLVWRGNENRILQTWRWRFQIQIFSTFLYVSCMCFEVGISGFDEAACEARVGFRFELPTKRIIDLYRIV